MALFFKSTAIVLPVILLLWVACLSRECSDRWYRGALFWLSVALWYDGIYEESIEVNERLVAAHPDYGEGYLQLGNALETAGRGSDAIDVYRGLLAITDDERLRQVGSTLFSKLEAEGSR